MHIFCSKTPIKIANRSILRNNFYPVIIFKIFITRQKHIQHQIYRFLQETASKLLYTMKHLLHMYQFTNVDYAGNIYTPRNRLLIYREELQFKNFEFYGKVKTFNFREDCPICRLVIFFREKLFHLLFIEIQYLK